jgi:hypothetical protein
MEDKMLKNELAGYLEYSRTVKYRLIPFIVAKNVLIMKKRYLCGGNCGKTCEAIRAGTKSKYQNEGFI